METEDKMLRSFHDPLGRSAMFSLLRRLGDFTLTEPQSEITVSFFTILRFSINLDLSEVAIFLLRAFPVPI